MQQNAVKKVKEKYKDSGIVYFYKKNKSSFSLIESVNIEDKKALRKAFLKVNGDVDIYCTVNTFKYSKIREEGNIYQLQNLIVDIDNAYNLDMYQLYEILNNLVELDKLPQFSKLVFSGNGYHIYFKIENATAFLSDIYEDMEKYILDTINEEMVKLNSSYKVDYNCKDVSRVLRVPNTINSKNGEKCFICWENKNHKEENLFDLAEKYISKPKKVKSKKRKIIQFSKTLYSLNVSRCIDFKMLVNLRFGDMKGYRSNITLMYAYFYNISNLEITLEQLEEEINMFNDMFNERLTEREISSICRLVNRKVDYYKVNNKNGYNYKNETIIDILDITKEEQSHMCTIIGKREKYDRNNKRRYENIRKEEGLTPKQKELKELKEKVLKLKDEGMSNRAIAKELNCSEGKIRSILKR